MIIEQTMEVSPNHSITIALPCSIPIGTMARVQVTIPTVFENQNKVEPIKAAKSFRGILKGKGISLERFQEMQRQDKAIEDAADERRSQRIR